MITAPCRYLLVVTLLAMTSDGAAQDWTLWRGPQRDGMARSFAEPAKWPERLSRVWKTEIGCEYSSPVVSGSRVWIHSRSGEDEIVSCLDLKSGQQLWSSSYAVAFSKNRWRTVPPERTP